MNKRITKELNNFNKFQAKTEKSIEKLEDNIKLFFDSIVNDYESNKINLLYCFNNLKSKKLTYKEIKQKLEQSSILYSEFTYYYQIILEDKSITYISSVEKDSSEFTIFHTEYTLGVCDNSLISRVNKQLCSVENKKIISAVLLRLDKLYSEYSKKYCEIFQLILIEENILEVKGFTTGAKFIQTENFSMPLIVITSINDDKINFTIKYYNSVINKTMKAYHFLCEYNLVEETEESKLLKKWNIRNEKIDILLSV